MPSPLRLIAIAVILIGLVLVSLRLLPGSPFESAAAAKWGDAVRPGDRPTGEAADRSARHQPRVAEPQPVAGAAAVRGQAIDLDIEGWYSWACWTAAPGRSSARRTWTRPAPPPR